MPAREQKSDLSFAQTIEPQVLAAPAVGASVDLQGFDSATIHVRYGGTVDAGTLFTIEESTDDTTFTAVTPSEKPVLDGVLLGASYPAAAVANTSHKYAYVGQARYIRANFGTVPAATDACVVVVRGNPAICPVD